MATPTKFNVRDFIPKTKDTTSKGPSELKNHQAYVGIYRVSSK